MSSAAAAAQGAPFFRGIGLVARRELAAYFDSRIAYVYTIAFVVLANSIFMNEFFLTGTVDMGGFFDLMPLLLPCFLPAVTMRLWAEERKTRTIELLLTLPIRASQAVLGKYAAALALFLLFLAGTLPIPIMLAILGDPDLGKIASGYLGLLLFGGFFLALGMFISALSADQIVTFVATAVACFAFVLLGHERVTAVLDGLAPKLALGSLVRDSFSVGPHYDSFVRGAVALGPLCWFALLAALFLWLTAHVLEQHRG